MNKFTAFLAILFPAVFLTCQTMRFAGSSRDLGVIIVANKGSNDLYFIDRLDGKVLKILPTGLGPHEVEVSDDGRIAVVCNYGNSENPGNTLSVYDVEFGELVRTIDLGIHTRPHGMFWMPGSGNMLVTTEGSRHLLKVDIETGDLLQEMYTGQDISHMVAATPDLRRAFVTSIASGNVSVFDLESFELIKHIHSGEGAEGIDISPDGREVWVTNRGENTISVIDAVSLELLDKIECGDFPIRAKFSPDGRYFLVSNARSGDIAVINVHNRELIKNIKLIMPDPPANSDRRYFPDFQASSVPIGLVIPDDSTAYVANTRSDIVTVISLRNLIITGFFKAGNEPDGINFSPLMPAAK
jgi:YVTN family beta-propeller protein